MLADPKETRRISDIASAFGFLRSYHFARAFKQQFGQPARDLRELALKHQQVATEAAFDRQGDAQKFDNWIRALHG